MGAAGRLPIGRTRRRDWREGLAVAGWLATLVAGPALANPTGGTVAAGSATITAPSPGTVAVVEQSERAIINWQSFSIGAGETTQFIQPNSGAFILNRVLGGDPSLIAGHLIANGNIAIVNGAGILFMDGSVVNVNSLVATPADITNADFMAGLLNFVIPPANPDATVVNEGHITVKEHGLAALVAPGVQNSGVIEAKLGKVVLGGAETFTVDFYGDGLINFDVGSKPAATLVSNTGRISADGGTILLSADAADTIVSNVVTGGTLDARTVGGNTGTVDIEGGTAQVGGAIDVSGQNPGETGGTVAVTGTNVALASGATIDASGAAGGGTVLIGGDFHGVGPLPNATTTTIAAGAAITADALTNGNGGNVAVWSNGTTVFAGSISAEGGAAGGNGGYVETSGSSVTLAGTVDTRAAAGAIGTWLIDPIDLTIGPTVSATINGSTTNVAVQASGNIIIDNNLTPKAGVSLGLLAGNDITLNANIDFATNSDTTGNLFLTAVGAITQTAGTITLDGGTASLAAGTGIGTSSVPLALAGLSTVAATSTAGGIFLANGSSGSVVVGAPSALTFTAGSSPTTNPELDDAELTIEESTGTVGSGANALVITTNDLSNTAVTFGALSGLAGAGDIALATLGNLDLEAAVGATTTGTITLAADSGASGTGLLTVNGAVGNADASDIALSAATIAITATVEGGGALTLAPSTAGAGIAIGTGATGTFALSAASLGNLGSGGGIGAGFSGITIGRADSTGAIDVNNGGGTLSFAAPLTLESAGAGGTITVATALTGSAGLALEAGGTASSTAISIAADITATGDLGLAASAGNIVLTGTVTGANVLLSATAGAVTATGGAVSTGDLIVLAGSNSALTASGNSVTILAADITSGGLAFTNNGGFAIGAASVSPPSIGTTTESGVTASGDVGLVATPGTLTLDQNVSGANVLLSATNGAVTESGGAISAGDLIVKAKRSTVLNTSTNSVSILAADVTNGGFAFTGESGFAVDSASVNPAGTGATALSGVTANADIGLVATAGTLTLDQNVSGNNVLLSATSGAVTENGGAVSATDLIVLAANDSALNASDNGISVLAADVTSGGLAFTNGSAFAVDEALVNPASTGAITQDNISATGDVGLMTSAGTLTLTENVSGANVLLSATSSAVTELGGTVSATDLIVLAKNDSVLTASGNSVGVLAADITSGGLAFTNGTSFAAGAASVNPASTGAIPESGVTASGDIGLVATTGTLTLTGTVSAANVLLSAAAGAVTENGGAISAGDLIVLAANDSALNASGNSVSVLAADVTDGGLAFTNGNAFAVNQASANPASTGAITQNNIVATGDVGLTVATETLTLDQNVTGANVLLSATSGAVTEAGGAVSAGDLIVNAEDASALNTTSNSVSVLGADVTAAGIGFTNAGAFTAGAASVNPANTGAVAQNGVRADGDSALVARTGDITVARAINVGSANLLLHAAGEVSESGTGAVTAGGLLLRAGTDVDLANANDVRTLAARYGTGLAFENGAALTVGAVSVSAPGISDTSNNTGVGDGTGSSDVALVVTSGSLSLSDDVDVGAHNLLLASDNSTVGGAGAITANGLALVMTGDVTLSASYTEIGASITGGFSYTGPSSYQAGVIVNSPALGGTFGVTATGDVGLVATTGTLTLTENVSGANVYLDAPAGAITESGGAVSATDLIVFAANSSALNAANSVAVLSADVTGGGFAFTNAGSFAVNEATVSPPTLGTITQDNVTASGDVGLEASSGNITLAENVSAANVLLSAATGGVNETTGHVIAGSGAGDLLVLAASNSALDAANDVGIVGANVTTGGFAFTNTDSFKVGAASVDPPGIDTTSHNGVSAGADVGLLASTGDLTLAKNVTGADAVLIAPFGAVTETTGAVVAGSGAGSLIVEAQNNTSLTSASNSVGVLAADISDGSLSFTNAGGFSIGSVSLSIPGSIVLGASPIAATDSGIFAVTALDLEAKTGSITQSNAIFVLGTTAIVTDGSGGSITLTNSGNDFSGTLTLDTASATGNASVTNDDGSGTSLAASSVGGNLTVVASTGTITETGNVTSGGGLALKAAGSIAIDTRLESTGGNLFLEADGGGSTIAYAGGNLTLGAAGSVSLVANAGIGGSGVAEAIPLIDAGGVLTLSATTATGGIYVAATDAAGTTIGAQATRPTGFAVDLGRRDRGDGRRRRDRNERLAHDRKAGEQRNREHLSRGGRDGCCDPVLGRRDRSRRRRSVARRECRRRHGERAGRGRRRIAADHRRHDPDRRLVRQRVEPQCRGRRGDDRLGDAADLLHDDFGDGNNDREQRRCRPAERGRHGDRRRDHAGGRHRRGRQRIPRGGWNGRGNYDERRHDHARRAGPVARRRCRRRHRKHADRRGRWIGTDARRLDRDRRLPGARVEPQRSGRSSDHRHGDGARLLRDNARNGRDSCDERQCRDREQRRHLDWRFDHVGEFHQRRDGKRVPRSRRHGIDDRSVGRSDQARWRQPVARRECRRWQRDRAGADRRRIAADHRRHDRHRRLLRQRVECRGGGGRGDHRRGCGADMV